MDRLTCRRPRVISHYDTGGASRRPGIPERICRGGLQAAELRNHVRAWEGGSPRRLGKYMIEHKLAEKTRLIIPGAYN
jgi:hypothetical protein